jgi:WD40 repeat protein
VAFSADGSRLASGGRDETVRVWDLRQANVPPIVLSGHHGNVSSVAFSPDGNRLASASDDTTVRLWDLRQPSASPLVLSGHRGKVSLVVFSPDGNRLASAGEDLIRLWDLRRPDASSVDLSGSAGVHKFATFSPDGNLLASSGAAETVNLWDLREPDAPPVVVSSYEAPVYSHSDPDPALPPPPPPSFLESLMFSHDGSRLVAAGTDGTLHIWPLWDAAADLLCGRVWRNLTLDEWNLYIGEGIPYQPTCSTVATLRSPK